MSETDELTADEVKDENQQSAMSQEDVKLEKQEQDENASDNDVHEPEKEQEKTAEVEAVENIMYIGPNSLTDGLKRFTVYLDEPTELIEQAEKKYKNIKRLFVPVGQLNQAMADVEKKGTPVYLAFHEVNQ